MLKTAEAGMQNNKDVLMVNKTTSFKRKGKSKKNKSTEAGKTESQKRNKGGATKRTECFYYKQKGH